MEVYRCVDRLADEYQEQYGNQKHIFSAPSQTVFFNDYCYGKLTPALNAWVEELSALLYFFHDIQKEKWPNILVDKLWQID